MTDNTTTSNSAAIAIRWGIIIAVISCVLSTVINMFLVENMIPYFGSLFLVFALQFVLFGVAATQQRKAMGGYMSFKESFRVVFIAILIVIVINTIFSQIYLHLIDPDLPAKLKEATLKFSEKMGATQEQLDQAAAKADEQMKEGQGIGRQVLGFFMSIVIYSLFGFIPAAIAKKSKPEPQQML